jgi:hypothetical protein
MTTRVARRCLRGPQVRACGRVAASRLAQLVGAFAGLVVDDLCVVEEVFSFVFLVLDFFVVDFLVLV